MAISQLSSSDVKTEMG